MDLNLPSDVSFLEDRKASVMLMRRLLSEVDKEKINRGRVQNHFDDLLWDGLKVTI